MSIEDVLHAMFADYLAADWMVVTTTPSCAACTWTTSRVKAMTDPYRARRNLLRTILATGTQIIIGMCWPPEGVTTNSARTAPPTA
jgi:hypothetical protein